MVPSSFKSILEGYVEMAVSVQTLKPMGRVLRHPQHRFQLRHRPWQIQPFMIAPVLPGETMKNLLLQARVVSDPVKNPLIGWWCEYYFFYVKHRDMTNRDLFTAMVLDPTANLSSLDAAAKVEHYHADGVDWVAQCMDRVVDEYFRDEPEVMADHMIGNLPAAKLGMNSWLDSVVNDADMVTADDVDLDLNADSTIMASEAEKAMRQWQFMRANLLTEMTYEDFLKSYGVRPSLADDPHRPELVRYVRDWTYPTNHVDPTDGTPSSALSWSVQERADKDRFFSEPGFLFGVTVVRPKVYLSKQAGNAASLLDDAYSWLPALLANDPASSLKKVAATTAPLSTNTDAYWVDMRDLFLYGDQFVNFALTETDAGMVAVPTAGLEKRYAAATDADALFSSASPKNLVRVDGVVSLSIAGMQRDAT